MNLRPGKMGDDSIDTAPGKPHMVNRDPNSLNESIQVGRYVEHAGDRANDKRKTRVLSVAL